MAAASPSPVPRMAGQHNPPPSPYAGRQNAVANANNASSSFGSSQQQSSSSSSSSTSYSASSQMSTSSHHVTSNVRQMSASSPSPGFQRKTISSPSPFSTTYQGTPPPQLQGGVPPSPFSTTAAQRSSPFSSTTPKSPSPFAGTSTSSVTSSSSLSYHSSSGGVGVAGSAATAPRSPVPPPTPPKPSLSEVKLRRPVMEKLDANLGDVAENEVMEPDLEDTSHMNFVDGRCSCCPYGYHVDVDFLQYLDGINSGSYLRNLKRIHRNKKKLRKSMEIFLQSQERGTQEQLKVSAPDVVKSTENYVSLSDYDDTATNQILDEIDTSVSATLGSIDMLLSQKGGDSESDLESPGPTQKAFAEMSESQRKEYEQRYRTEAALLLSRPPQQEHMEKADSVSSLSSQSTFSSEPASSVSNQQQTTTRITTTTRTYITASELADNMASLLPGSGGGSGAGGSTTESQEVVVSGSNTEAVSPATLGAIREQMAISLQRMRELEEQVKAIPVLQVRISVLKEEKRLAALQLKAKNSKLNMRSVGVGSGRIDDKVAPYMNGEYSGSRSIGIGDFDVREDILIIAKDGVPIGTRIHERELKTEQNTHVHEKETKTVFLGQSQNSVDSSMFKPKVAPRPPPKPHTRNIGTGDGNVFDLGSNMHVHEKEMRTVFIGADEEEEDDKPLTRNVGITCKAAVRDVGVMYYHEDDASATRSIAIGCGEIGVGEGALALLDENGELSSGSTSIHHSHLSMNQMNMAAFHSQHIHIKNEQLRLILDSMLKKELKSVATQSQFSTENKGTDPEHFSGVDVGCGGENSIDVDVRKAVTTRSVAVDNRPSMSNKSAMTGKFYSVDMGTMTPDTKVHTIHRSTNTAPKVMYPAATNTEYVHKHNVNTETELKVFQATNQVKTSATNTPPKPDTVNYGVNTESNRQLDTKSMTFDVCFATKGQNTDQAKYTRDRGVNTQEIRTSDVGVATKPVQQLTRSISTERYAMNSASKAVNTDPRSFSSKASGATESAVSPTTTSAPSVCQTCLNRPPSPQTRSTGIVTEPVNVQRKTSEDAAEDMINQLESNLQTTVVRSQTTNLQSAPVPQRDSGSSGGTSSRTVTTTTRSMLGGGGVRGGGVDRIRTSEQSRQSSSSNSPFSACNIGGVTIDDDGERSNVTKTVTTRTIIGSSPGLTSTRRTIRSSGEDVDGGSGSGGMSSSSTRTVIQSSPGGTTTRRTITSSGGGGDDVDMGGSGGMSSSSTSSTRTVTRMMGDGGELEEAEGTDDSGLRSSGGYSMTRTVTSGSAPDSSSSSSSSTRTVTRTMGGGGGASQESEDTDDSGLRSSGGYSMTRTVTSGSAPDSSSTSSSSSTRTVTRMMGGGGGASQESEDTDDSGLRNSGGYSMTRTVTTGSAPDSSSTSSSSSTRTVTHMGGGGGGASQESNDTSTEDGLRSSGGYSMTRTITSGSAPGSSSRTVITRTSRGSSSQESDDDLMRGLGGHSVTRIVSGGDGGGSSGGGGSSSRTVTTRRTVTSSGGGGSSSSSFHGSGGDNGKSSATTTTSRVVKSSGKSSEDGDGGGEIEEEIQYTRGPGGGQMRVIRHVETTYVGGRPVKTSSNVEVSPDGEGAAAEGAEGGGTGMQDSGITLDASPPGKGDKEEMEMPVSVDLSSQAQGSSGGVKKMVITETRIEKRAVRPGDEDATQPIKSIMRKNGGEKHKKVNVKKEISFSDDVVGGYVSGSGDEEEDGEEEAEVSAEDMEEEEGDEEDMEEELSDTSYDEGSYDGRQGKIVYTCKDDEAIGTVPGCEMYGEQSIRQTVELPEEVVRSCETYAQWLDDSTQITSKELNQSLSVIQAAWFKVAGMKLSMGQEVEDYLSNFHDLSPELLQHIVNMGDASGNTALHYAVSHCNLDIVSLLLDTELVDVNKENKAGYTAIMLAALATPQTDPDKDIIRRLYELGDVNARASQAGQTALMLAVSHGRHDMVRMLLEAGADVNSQDEDGSTALMCASEHGHADIVKLLLAHPDTDPTLTDNDGSTALSIAMEAGHRDIGVLLYAHLNFKQGSP